MDFNVLYKEYFDSPQELKSGFQCDVFISAFNPSQRVGDVFDSVSANRKIWIIHPEYDLTPSQYPSEESFHFELKKSESENVRNFFSSCKLERDSIDGLKVCIDSTGMMRQSLLFMILYLYQCLAVKTFDVIYTEPVAYSKSEDTQFSLNTTGEVTGVDGFELGSAREQTNDLLIIGSGFDNKLIAEVAESKKHAKKAQIIGFPSLQADMYQQNLLRVAKVDEIKSEGRDNIYFASASDPFETASVLKYIVDKFEQKSKITNLYLSPLSTKAQTLGFALFYIYECLIKSRDASIIMPETDKYSEKTSIGIAHIWAYKIELP